MISAKEQLKNIKDRESTKVKGTFIYHECPGGTLRFNYHIFAGTPVEKWEFTDGEAKEVPLYIAKHLNNSGMYKTKKRAVGPNGEYKVTIPFKRYSFNSTDFLEFPDRSKELVTVEKVSEKVFTAPKIK